MITLAWIAGVSAAAVAAGRWLVGRADPGRACASPPVERRARLSLGDVVVLDGGRGVELSLAHALELHEGDSAPWLVVFEADGPASARRWVVDDPTDPDGFAVVQPAPSEQAFALPDTLELGGEWLTRVARRASRGVVASVGDAEGPCTLPTNGLVLVARYRGAAGREGLVCKQGARIQLWVGERHSFGDVSILRR